MSQAKSNKMGVVQLTILTMVNMMGSGIIMLPTKLAEVGTISIISWLVTAVGSMALAWAFAKCGMFSRKSGGMGGYAEYAFGKSGNFMANYTYGVSLLIANVAIAISAVGYGTELLGASLSPVQIGLATIGVLWICTVANFGGARITGQISSITVWGSLFRSSVCALLAGSGLARRCTLILESASCTVLQCGRFFHRYDAVGFSWSGVCVCKY